MGYRIFEGLKAVFVARNPSATGEPRLTGVVDYRGERSWKPSLHQVLRNSLPNCDDPSVWSSHEIDFFLKQVIPSVIPFFPRQTRTSNQHRSLGQIGDVVSLLGCAKIASNAKVKDGGLIRGEEVPESRFHS